MYFTKQTYNFSNILRSDLFKPEITSEYESSIHSNNCCEGTVPSIITVFQCFLFIWYPGKTASYSSLNSIAFSGSHLRFICSGIVSSEASKKILPATLNTRVSSPKGNSSVTPFS